MTSIWYSQFKVADIGGGINTFNTPTEINDNQFTDIVNFHTGNGNLETSKVGAVAYTSIWTWYTIAWLEYSRSLDKTAYIVQKSATNDTLYIGSWTTSTPITILSAKTVYVNTVANSTHYTITYDWNTWDYISSGSATSDNIILGLWNIMSWLAQSALYESQVLHRPWVTWLYDMYLTYDQLYTDWNTTIKWYISIVPYQATSFSKTTNLSFWALTWLPSSTNTYLLYWGIPRNGWSAISVFNTVYILSSSWILYYFDWIKIVRPLVWFSWKITCLKIFQSRLFLAVDNTIYYSKPSSIMNINAIFDFSWYPANFQVIGDWPNIVGFAENNDTFYIYTRNSSYRILGLVDDGINSNYYEVRKISQNLTDSQRFIVNVDKEIFYFDTYDKTVRRMYYEEYSQDLAGQDLGLPIRPSLALCTTTNGHLSYKYPYVKLRLTTTVENDTTYTYNVIDKSWTQQTSVVKFASYGKYAIYGDSAIYNDDSDTTSRSGSANSKHYPMGNSVEYKRFKEFELYGNLASWSSFTFTLSLSSDWTTFCTYPITVTTWEFKKKFSIFMDAKSINVGISYTNQSWLLQIYGYNVRYKLIPTFEIYS